MNLTHHQKKTIYDQGFVQIPGVVPQLMIERAMKSINHSIGEGMNADEMTTLRSRSYCPEIQRDAEITDLFNETPARSLVESAIGEGRINPLSSGQIAVRFPTLQDPPPQPQPHLDGMHSPHNGVPEGKILNFTSLVAVFLSDVPAPFSGNFTAWPATHHLYEEYFREHGPQSLLEGMPPVELPEPQQIIARAGDIALCHYQIAHSAAINVSPYPRYAIFFRLNHVEHDQQKEEAMKDIWLEWEGMKEVLPEATSG
jgi:hypothetical protein